jgi:hypothetical protein
MHASDGDHRPVPAEPDPEALLRMRIAVADAAFVAEGVTLGLLLKWAERAPPFDDLPPPLLARRAPKNAVLWSAASPRAVVNGGRPPPG